MRRVNNDEKKGGGREEEKTAPILNRLLHYY